MLCQGTWRDQLTKWTKHQTTTSKSLIHTLIPSTGFIETRLAIWTMENGTLCQHRTYIESFCCHWSWWKAFNSICSIAESNAASNRDICCWSAQEDVWSLVHLDWSIYINVHWAGYLVRIARPCRGSTFVLLKTTTTTKKLSPFPLLSANILREFKRCLKPSCQIHSSSWSAFPTLCCEHSYYIFWKMTCWFAEAAAPVTRTCGLVVWVARWHGG